MAWDNEQRFEADWWGDCANTLGEQFKYPTYARLMGIPFVEEGGRYIIDKAGKSILDVGGGPCSMLLCTRAEKRTVVDPCPYPEWTRQRYAAAGIEVVRSPAENFSGGDYDEAWCYNVLQHTKDPQRVIDMMLASARVIRMFEWVNIPPHPGHPHELKSKKLAEWAGIRTWAETWIGWDHWVGGEYNDYLAFHGHTEAS
jgi:hypothetical protein